MYRLCIGYVSVILHAGREETGANRRTSAKDKQGISKGGARDREGTKEV